MRKVYEKIVRCGEMKIDISKDNDIYSLSVKMEKFGECTAYVFISDMIMDALNSGIVSLFSKTLKDYKCQLGKKDEKGCIEAIGECLEEFEKEN